MSGAAAPEGESKGWQNGCFERKKKDSWFSKKFRMLRYNKCKFNNCDILMFIIPVKGGLYDYLPRNTRHTYVTALKHHHVNFRRRKALHTVWISDSLLAGAEEVCPDKRRSLCKTSFPFSELVQG